MDWITLEPLRSYKEIGVLGDACNHAKGAPGYPWTNYLDKDQVTSGHELVHSINARIRNEHSGAFYLPSAWTVMELVPTIHGKFIPRLTLPGAPGEQPNNGYYLAPDKALCLQNPLGVKLSDVAEAVPRSDRKGSYRLYMVQQQKYWDDFPLYPLDEVCCYLVGAKVGWERNLDDRMNQSLERGKEMLRYSAIASELTRREGYESQDKLEEFLDMLQKEFSYF